MNPPASKRRKLDEILPTEIPLSPIPIEIWLEIYSHLDFSSRALYSSVSRQTLSDFRTRTRVLDLRKWKWGWDERLDYLKELTGIETVIVSTDLYLGYWPKLTTVEYHSLQINHLMGIRLGYLAPQIKNLSINLRSIQCHLLLLSELGKTQLDQLTLDNDSYCHQCQSTLSRLSVKRLFVRRYQKFGFLTNYPQLLEKMGVQDITIVSAGEENFNNDLFPIRHQVPRVTFVYQGSHSKSDIDFITRITKETHLVSFDGCRLTLTKK